MTECEILPRNRSVVVWRKNRLHSGTRKRVRTICEVLRELYRDAEARVDHVSMTRIDEAHDMAKRMQTRLEEYAGKARADIYLVRGDDGTEWLTKANYKQREKSRT